MTSSVDMTEGEATLLNASMAVKLTTMPYENISFGASISLKPKPGADLDKAFDQMWAYLNTRIKPMVSAIDRKFGKQRGE